MLKGRFNITAETLNVSAVSLCHKSVIIVDASLLKLLLSHPLPMSQWNNFRTLAVNIID